MQLQDVARVLRSKNAGPCLITFDVMFGNREDYDRVCLQLARLRTEVASRYGRSENEVRVIAYEPAQAVKITIPRDMVSGDPGDRDVYGAQQHAPLLEIEI
jgi:hypothetical protein